MQCPTCEKTIPDESRFCSYCGSSVSAAQEETSLAVPCARCAGTGRLPGFFGESQCPGCRGKGTVQVAAPARKCPLCGGSGRQEGFINKAVCGVCWGTGWADVLK